MEQLLSLYLVRATPQRLLAYRRYREESSDYWTEEQLARLHWEFLYEQVSPCSQKPIWDSLGVERNAVSLRRNRMSHSRRKNRDLNVRVVRVRLCKQIGIAEESVPMGRLSDFFKEHEPYARLPLDNSGVKVVKDSMPQAVVSVYGQVLKEKSVQSLDGIFYELAVEVTKKHKLVVWPKCAGEACAVAAYAMLEAKKLFGSQCWSGSQLSSVQRSFSNTYLPTDFEFWARYGSWSCCKHCGG